MVTAAEIHDEASLRAWLEGRPREDAALFGARSSLRVAPIAWARHENGERERERAALPICRALLISGVAVKSSTQAISDAADYAFAGAYSASDKDAAEGDVDAHARYSAAEAVFAIGGSADYALSAVARAAAAGSFANRGSDVWEQICEDARMLEVGEESLDAPLWSIPLPDWFREADAAMRALWQADPAYAFWLRWWDGVLSGKQLPWDLQEKVALIPNEVWQQGAEAVAAEIARIEEQVRLLREVERLKAHLASARSEIAAPSRRGHNNPPELVEPVAEIERQASEISKALEDAARELKSDVPRPAVLRRVGRALLNATAKLLTYCASLGDVALRKSAEAAGAAGGAALVATLTGHWQEVQSLAQALLAFARSLGGE